MKSAKKNLIDLQKLGNNIRTYLTGPNEQQQEEHSSQPFFNPYSLQIKSKNKESDSETIMQLGSYHAAINKRLDQLEKQRFTLKLWSKDAELWNLPSGSKEIVNSMGWLTVVEEMKEYVPEIKAFAEQIKNAGFRKVVLLGMGGSSLAPYVFEQAFANVQDGFSLTVLDTTDPYTIESIEFTTPLEHTLFIVASKSGTTAEVSAMFDYFYDKVKALKGEKAGKNFVSISDPGTPLVKLAKKLNFRHTFLNFADIGGRYSALSFFGLVPAALIGVDIDELLNRAIEMTRKCAADVPVNKNEGVKLGAVLGELARNGRNKLTLLIPENISSFSLWIEQLVAESTGKAGLGILPVNGTPLGDPELLGDDRVFVSIQFSKDWDHTYDSEMKTLVNAGHPVITLFMKDVLDLGQELFRWEIATATAGAVLGINPFDQPNVQENKDVTNQFLKELELKGSLTEEKPLITEKNLAYYSTLTSKKGVNLLEEFFSKAHPGDFISIQAYLPESKEINEELDQIRFILEDWLCLATTTGYGPRFLHSTGQFHKGGPNNGLFVQITGTHSNTVEIPGRKYTFGDLINAQALGDYKVLCNHKRKVIRINLGENIVDSLRTLKLKIEEAQTENLMNMNHTE